MHKIHFKCLFGWLMKPNTNVLWNEKHVLLYIYSVYYKYMHGSLNLNGFFPRIILYNVSFVKIVVIRPKHQELDHGKNYIIHIWKIKYFVNIFCRIQMSNSVGWTFFFKFKIK
jgi:hypothetical protein